MVYQVAISLDHLQAKGLNQFVHLCALCGLECTARCWLHTWGGHKIEYELPIDLITITCKCLVGCATALLVSLRLAEMLYSYCDYFVLTNS